MAAGLLVSAMLGYGTAAASGEGGNPVAPPNAVRYHMTYPEWEAAYQTWVEEISLGKNPLAHPDSPRNCELQPGNVVFVSASGADCAIPSGAWVGLSTYFWECSTAEGLGDTFRQLRRCAEENAAHDFGPQVSHTTLKIDGTKLNHPRRWTFTTPGEIIDFPKHNLWGADPGPSKSVTAGTLYLVRPLDGGTHHIRLHVNDKVIGQFNVDYWLQVG
jgi:hypothetical protein